MSATKAMVEVRDLCVSYGRGPHATQVLHAVDLTVLEGRTVAVVGESGSGKSTLAKALVGALRPTSGSIEVAGIDVTSASKRERSQLRQRIQLIPQDPYSSLDPRRTIGEALAEAIDPVHARVRKHRARILEWLDVVRMPGDAVDRYPHEFSGGQRQRIAIARGLMREPDVIVADEITSALDVSVQAEILSLLARIRGELGLTMVFISHNLAVVEQVADDVLVLLRGEQMESGSVADVFSNPTSEYTRALLDAVPGAPGFSLRV